MTKKTETIIHRANGGNHSPVNYRKHKNMLLTHPYALGLLYHIVLTGSEDRKVYRKAVELLCKQLRASGMPCRYKACYERDKHKRFHKHVFILIEAKHFHPDTIIHFRKGHWFTETLNKLGLSFKIAQPQDPIHNVSGKQVNYAYVPKKASPKLDDCLLWISYLTKVRSKEGVEGQIYTASTNRVPKKPLPPIAALPAAEETKHIDEGINESDVAADSETVPFGSPAEPQGTSGTEALVDARQSADRSEEVRSETGSSTDDERYSASRVGPSDKRTKMILTASQKYVAAFYEHCVDAELDVDEIRRYLLEKGVVRTPGQVAWELEHEFSFTGYASSHQPKPQPSMAEWMRAGRA